MTTLMQASRQWATRPDDQRFTSLTEMQTMLEQVRDNSRAIGVSSRKIGVQPVAEDASNKSLVVIGPDGTPTVPTHWAFGQLASRVKAPSGYLRTLPADIAADALNYGLRNRPIEDLGVLLRGGDDLPVPALGAVTGPNYGRIWNSDILSQLISRFGDGRTGQFTVPGEFGRKVEITKDNTTLFASDRDMFVFLADEQNRVEVKGRRNGQPGELSRGFFVWNSEVGSRSFGIATFLFDYVCSNRIVWGAQEYGEFTLRHTVSAPDKFAEEIAPAIEAYAQKPMDGIRTAIETAQQAKFEDRDTAMDWMAKRFTKDRATAFNLAHMADEDRPIESLWDVATGMTAYARGVKHQDARVDLEREAGKVLTLAGK